MQVTPLRESKETKKVRIEGQNAHRDTRSERSFRIRKKGAKSDVELANAFRNLGIDFLKFRGESFAIASKMLEGTRVDRLSPESIMFLNENFDIEQMLDLEGRRLLHFNPITQLGDGMNLLKAIAEKTEVQRKTVREVYDAMLEIVQEQLKAERKVRLPGFGIIAVKFRPAKPKRKGRNPFNGKEMMFKAKPASNKLKITPAKDMKVFASKLPVIAPKGKKAKKSKKSK